MQHKYLIPIAKPTFNVFASGRCFKRKSLSVIKGITKAVHTMLLLLAYEKLARAFIYCKCIFLCITRGHDIITKIINKNDKLTIVKM